MALYESQQLLNLNHFFHFVQIFEVNEAKWKYAEVEPLSVVANKQIGLCTP